MKHSEEFFWNVVELRKLQKKFFSGRLCRSEYFSTLKSARHYENLIDIEIGHALEILEKRKNENTFHP